MIYDVILFFNEMELLALRLEHLNDMVDKHFLLESSVTCTGNSKPFYFDIDAPSIARFKSKIVYLRSTLDIPIPSKPLSNWRREFFQRDLLRSAVLPFVDDDDLVFTTDADQFPNPAIWDKAINLACEQGVACIEMSNHMYFFNRVFDAVRNAWPYSAEPSVCNNTRLSSGSWFKNPPLPAPDADREISRSAAYRTSYFHDPLLDVKNGGWHFSSMGGKESILYKLESVSHHGEDPEDTHAKSVRTDFMKLVYEHTKEYPVEKLPVCIQRQQDHLRQIGFLL